jgi:hypothetical protein
MNKNFKKFRTIIAVAAISATLCTACSSDDEGQPNSVLADKYFSVQNGTLHNGAIPVNAGGSQVGNVSLNRNALAGGSSFVSINSGNPISELYIGVTGVDGYFSVPASSPSGSSPLRLAAASGNDALYTFVLLFSQNLNGSFEIQIGARLSDGSIATVYTAQIAYIAAGTGGLQISLSFDNDKDVDLYVVQPDQRVVYYGSKGEYTYDEEGHRIVLWGLDVDSNAGCSIDGIDKENVFYPREYIQTGIYEVWVNMYSNCDATVATNWVITTIKEGSLVTPSYGQNPATGVFPVGTPSNSIGSTLNERAIKVMEFNMQGTAPSGSHIFKVSPLSESAKIKLQKAGVNN